MSGSIDRLRRSVDEFDRRVHAIGGEQWDRPTPCVEWNVRDLVNHLVYEDRWAPHLLDGETLEQVGDRYDGDLLGDDPAGVWGEARDGLLGALDRVDPSRPIDTSMGPMPLEEYLSQLFADHLVHAWDLARGIGADEGLDPSLVDACLQLVRPRRREMRTYGVFGPDVDEGPDATTQQELLAIFGRRA